MGGAEPAKLDSPSQPKISTYLVCDLRSEDGCPRFIESHQVAIKEGIEVSAEEEAVEHIQALGIGDAFSPRFGVAGAQKLGDSNAGDGAGFAPVVHQAFAIDVLTHALANKALDLGGRCNGVGGGQFFSNGLGKSDTRFVG